MTYVIGGLHSTIESIFLLHPVAQGSIFIVCDNLFLTEIYSLDVAEIHQTHIALQDSATKKHNHLSSARHRTLTVILERSVERKWQPRSFYALANNFA